MNREAESAAQTGRLLAELDRMLDQSSALRDIMRRYEQLRELESIIGPSLTTRDLRQEISRLEQRLRAGRHSRFGRV